MRLPPPPRGGPDMGLGCRQTPPIDRLPIDIDLSNLQGNIGPWFRPPPPPPPPPTSSGLDTFPLPTPLPSRPRPTDDIHLTFILGNIGPRIRTLPSGRTSDPCHTEGVHDELIDPRQSNDRWGPLEGYERLCRRPPSRLD